MIFKASGKPQNCARIPHWGGGILVVVALGLGGAFLHAGEGGPGAAGLANREVAKREAMRQQAQTLIRQGADAEVKRDFVGAMKDYRQAYDLLPNAPMTAQQRTVARDGYSRAANAQARKLADEARYGEAHQLLATVLADDFDPSNHAAKQFLKQLDDPQRFEPALTPEHKLKVTQVTQLLLEAKSLMNLGDFDGADRKYQAVLRLDSYNTAARRGRESMEHERAQYFEAARDHQRARMLNVVAAGWEDAVPVTDVSQFFGGGANPNLAVAGGKDSILEKLRTWIVPAVDLQGASLDEVLEFLRIRSRDVDPNKRGISFVLRAPPDAKSRPITLSLTQVPLEELLRYVTQMSGTAYHVDEYAVTITSLTEVTTTMIQRFYRVPPDFIETAPIVDPAAAPPALDPFAKTKNAPAPQLQGLNVRRLSAREFLEQRGVAFPEGSAASYSPATSILMVRDTIENLAQVEALVDQARNSSPKQVLVSVRLIDVDQTNLNELGFDWLLGQSNVPGSSGLFTGGGGGNTTSTDYPFVYPGTTTAVGGSSITSGLRSSGAILGQPSIDTLVHQGGAQVGGSSQTPTLDSKSPGVFSIVGAFTDPQFQMVLRALSQKKGVDLMTSPSIVAKSGQRATITVAREFPYPTEFNPPQIPTTIGTIIPGGGVNTLFAGNNTAPVTPTTPTAFTKRDVGITIEVEPVVDGNNKLIHLNVIPSSTEFEGFINYGSDITTVGGGVQYNQPNKILQPVFRSNKTNTAVDIWDGSTLAIAGVITETRTDIEDKIPILGSIPILGRAFQSKVSQVERRNVAFFVSVRIIDPAGNPVNQVTPGSGPGAASPPTPPVASTP